MIELRVVLFLQDLSHLENIRKDQIWVIQTDNIFLAGERMKIEMCKNLRVDYSYKTLEDNKSKCLMFRHMDVSLCEVLR